MSRTLPARALTALAALLLALAACGGGDGVGDATTGTPDSSDDPSTTGGGTTPAAGEEPLLMVTYEGGFASPSMFASLGPAFVVTTDGQLIFQGPVPEIFPGPLVPPYQVTDVSDLLPDLEDILDRLGIAEMTEEINDNGADMVADASTTVLTYFDAEGPHRYGVYALGFDPQAEVADPEVVALNDLLLTLQEATFSGEPPEPYTSDRWQVVVNGDFVPGEPGVPEDVRPYPLEAAVADFGHTSFGLPCTVLEGDAAAEAATAFADATQVTVWDTGTEEVQLLPRPLLPGEDGCQNA